MATLKEKLSTIIPNYRDEVKQLGKEHGDVKVSEVNVQQLLGGMRGVKGLLCDTSVVDPQKGVIIRGYPIADIKEKLPEEIFWLLLTGELPSADELAGLQKDIAERSELPQYVVDVLKAMPKDSHPMTMYNTGILVMQHESEFAKRYNEGMAKDEMWEPALDDAMTILGRATSLAAAVYRIRYGDGDIVKPDRDKDMGANLAAMIVDSEKPQELAELMRLFLTLHSDHESGNASAFTTHTVGSTLADPFYAYSAGMNALAGPLHGKANQDVLAFILDLMSGFDSAPSLDQLKDFVWDRLNNKQVIPGYGHAVLRQTDPRFTALYEFGEKHIPDDPTFKVVSNLFKIVPDILTEHGKAANPFPNVDAGSGAVLQHYGLKEYEFYTVLFGVSRALGVLSQLVLHRGIGTAIMRPKSVQTSWVKQHVGA